MPESHLSECNQKGCGKPAAYLYTWPGRNLAGVCEEHKAKAASVADAMGFHLQFIPVTKIGEGPNRGE